MNKLKLIFAVLFMSSFMFACGGASETTEETDSTKTDSTEAPVEDKSMEETPAPADSTETAPTDSTAADTTKAE